MTHSASRIAVGFSQSKLFFQLQMAACYEGRHFLGTQRLKPCSGNGDIWSFQGMAIFRVSLRRAVEHSPGMDYNLVILYNIPHSLRLMVGNSKTSMFE